MKMTEKFLKLINAIGRTEKLIRVKTWKPSYDPDIRLICWPTVLVDSISGRRATVTPAWNWCRIKYIFLSPKPYVPEKLLDTSTHGSRYQNSGTE